MYTLTVINNYIQDIGASNGVTILKSNQHVFKDRRSLILTIPGMSDMNIMDLGIVKLAGFPEPKEKWGVLIRYSNIEAYYRYEEEGALTATIDPLGTCSLTATNGSMIPISLPELIIESI